MTAIKVEVDGVEFGGSYTVKDGTVTVTGPTGRTKTTQAGARPDQIALVILSEIVAEDMGAMPDDLEEIAIELKND